VTDGEAQYSAGFSSIRGESRIMSSAIRMHHPRSGIHLHRRFKGCPSLTILGSSLGLAYFATVRELESLGARSQPATNHVAFPRITHTRINDFISTPEGSFI
jgi:hypothetical protein